MNINRTVLSGLNHHAKISGEGDRIDYPARLGAAEATLMIAINYVMENHGEDAARDLVKALRFDIVDQKEKR